MIAILVGILLAGTPDPVPGWPASPAPIVVTSSSPAPSPIVAPRPTPSPVATRVPAPTGSASSSIAGVASWGYFDGHVVTRYPRGTAIRVCGALGCWSGASWGYGPAIWTHRIADLDRAVFAAICGPPSRGVCNVVLTRL